MDETGVRPTGRVRRRLEITGVVQGVFYRDSCVRRAQQLGVAGHVRNQPDGSVEAVVEGAPDAVAAMVAWCEVGPAGARVDQVEVTEEEPTGATRFDILT